MTHFRCVSWFCTAVALTFAAALFPGCQKQSQDSATAAAAAAPAPAGEAAPAWKLKDLDGHEVSFAQFKGKVVVVDFWATWCGPCVSEIPGYVELQKKYGPAGLVIVGVSLDTKSPEYVKQFAQAHGMDYTLVMGDDSIVDAFGGFDAIPTTFLINRAGHIVHKKTGAMPHADYEKLVQQALN
jgi:peroxiredoxin